MNKLGRFALTVVLDSAMAFVYYLWQFEGMERAGNVFMFMVWFVGVAGVLILLAKDPAAKDYNPQPFIHRWFCRAATLAFLVGTVWAGHIVAACFYTFAWVVSYGRGVKAKELWEAAR